MGSSTKDAIDANPVLRALWSYWNERRGRRAMPSRKDIDPVDIPALLPFLQLVEAVGDRFRFRLAGTAIVQAYGVEMTGMFVDQFMPNKRGEVAARNFRLVQDTGRPLFARNEYATARGAHCIATRIVLPLWTGGDVPVGLTLTGTTFEYASKLAAHVGMDTTTLVGLADCEFITGQSRYPCEEEATPGKADDRIAYPAA